MELETAPFLHCVFSPRVVRFIAAGYDCRFKAETIARQNAQRFDLCDYVPLWLSIVVVPNEQQQPSREDGFVHIA
jgi:hypothetical protein